MAQSKVAFISSDEILITNVQDALDLMATIRYQYACDKMVLPKSAIVGDFEIYGSKSLRDFIYESNKGSQVFFMSTDEAAVAKLHSV